jgi:hypothetical protein
MTEQVDHEHQTIRTALDGASAACAAWRSRPSAETGEALAAALDRVNAVVQPHLDDEEQEIVPLAAVTLTQPEWDALGKHGVGQIPRSKRPIAFGMILEPLGAADRAYMMGSCLPRAMRAGRGTARSAGSLRVLAPCQIPASLALSHVGSS